VLAELAVLTGGRSFQLRDARGLQATLTTIARELRYQYLLGYEPADSPEAGGRRWRSIRVSLKRPARGVTVRARDGYFAE
jgi:Ca-activated chloride channel family protein